MLIIGCDFHPGFEQVAIFDNQTGEIEERRLGHREEAEQYYRSLKGQGVRVGMEACGQYPWFERLLSACGIELWVGNAAKIRASAVRKQKTDRRDGEHLMRLLMEERFPRIWVPTLEERDARQLLVDDVARGLDIRATAGPCAGEPESFRGRRMIERLNGQPASPKAGSSKQQFWEPVPKR